MDIKVLKVGYLQCNCYILDINNKVLVIDPGADYYKIKENLKDKEVLGVLLTHSHFDHIGCVKDIVNDYNIKVYSYDNLKEKEYNIGPFTFDVINTSGHTKDCVTYYFKKDRIMFTGDFLFYNTIGRCDLEGSNYQEMLKSIEKIKQYNKDVIVYPGHGISTTLGREFLENPYFN